MCWYVSLTAGMTCLLDVYKNTKQNIAETCVKMLDERISLWQLAVTVSIVCDSISESVLLALIFMPQYCTRHGPSKM